MDVDAPSPVEGQRVGFDAVTEDSASGLHFGPGGEPVIPAQGAFAYGDLAAGGGEWLAPGEQRTSTPS
jgi:hypothetical protein